MKTLQQALIKALIENNPDNARKQILRAHAKSRDNGERAWLLAALSDARLGRRM